MNNFKKILNLKIIISFMAVIIIGLFTLIVLFWSERNALINHNAYPKSETKIRYVLNTPKNKQIKDIIFLKNDSILYKYIYVTDSSLTRIESKLENLQSYNDLIKNSNDVLSKERAFLTLLLSLIGLTSILIGLWSTLGLKYSFEEKIIALKNESTKQLDNIKIDFSSEKIKVFNDFKNESKDEVEIYLKSLNDLGNNALVKFKEDLILRKKIEVYQYGLSNFNKQKYEIALSYFYNVYKSNYRLETTCIYLGICYKMLDNEEMALKYLSEAKSLNIKNANLLEQIQREIDEIEKPD